MLTTIRDDRRWIQAACDWWLVDSEGTWDGHGAWVYVNQLELSPYVQSLDMIRRIIEEIARLCPWALGAYWERRDKSKFALRTYTRQQLINQLCEEVRV